MSRTMSANIRTNLTHLRTYYKPARFSRLLSQILNPGLRRLQHSGIKAMAQNGDFDEIVEKRKDLTKQQANDLIG